MDRISFIKTGISTSLGLTLMPTLIYAGTQDKPEPIKTAIEVDVISDYEQYIYVDYLVPNNVCCLTIGLLLNDRFLNIGFSMKHKDVLELAKIYD